MKLRSLRTSITGISAGIAIIAKAVADASVDGWGWDDISLIAAAVALALQGIFARDDRITSEGTIAPKVQVPG